VSAKKKYCQRRLLVDCLCRGAEYNIRRTVHRSSNSVITYNNVVMAEYHFFIYILCVHFPSVKCQINFQIKAVIKKAQPMTWFMTLKLEHRFICECKFMFHNAIEIFPFHVAWPAAKHDQQAIQNINCVLKKMLLVNISDTIKYISQIRHVCLNMKTILSQNLCRLRFIRIKHACCYT